MNLPARRANGQLIGGQGSLNPSGKPRNSIGILREKYMHRLPELMDGLFLLTGPDYPAMTRIAATKEIFDRLLGKPQVTIEATHTSVSVAELYKAAMLKASRANSVEGKANEIDAGAAIAGRSSTFNS
jgi:hypothetical protein